MYINAPPRMHRGGSRSGTLILGGVVRPISVLSLYRRPFVAIPCALNASAT